MSPDQPFVAEPDPTAPFRRAINGLLACARDLLGRVQAAITHQDTAHLPRRLARNPVSAEIRLTRTLEWIFALARTLAGDRAWLITPTYLFPRFPGRFPPMTAKLREEIGLPPLPPATEAQKAAARHRYMKKIFATQPTAIIARRLARRLGLTASSDFWPKALLEVPQTPAAWAKSAHAPRPPPQSQPAPPPQACPTPRNAPQIQATGPPGRLAPA